MFYNEPIRNRLFGSGALIDILLANLFAAFDEESVEFGSMHDKVADEREHEHDKGRKKVVDGRDAKIRSAELR